MNIKKQNKTFQINSIGVIKANEEQSDFSLIINEAIRPALKLLNNFNYVLVFWWADKMDNEKSRNILTTDLPYAKGIKAGVFACRSEYRPNPIAITISNQYSCHHEPVDHPTAPAVVYKTIPTIITPIPRSDQVIALLLGANIPTNNKITKITESATPTLGKISEKKVATKLNCKAIKPTATAITALIDLCLKNSNFSNNPKINANNNENIKQTFNLFIFIHRTLYIVS